MYTEALNKISYGLYIVSSKCDTKNNYNGQIVNTAFQVSAEPPLIAVCINKMNLTHGCISKSGMFSISILSKSTPMEFIGRFGFRSGRDIDKFDGIEFKIIDGLPVVTENTVAILGCKVIDSFDVGSHSLFIGKILWGKIINNKDVMTYDFYHRVKGGISPKNAPTYIKLK